MLSITKATALEVLSEPLSLLVLLAALVLAVLTPAFHYHQFGEPTRMARDAGLSAHFVCGCVMVVFGAIRTVRREEESGTMSMALVHPVSRSVFILAKALGVGVAGWVFSAIVAAATLTMVTGAEIGGEIAHRTGDIARLWGPSLVAGVGVLVLPLVVGAALNRFGGFRFVLSVVMLALCLSASAGLASFVLRPALCARLLPLVALILMPVTVLLLAAVAFAVRLKANAAASCVGLVFLAMMPAVGNYYLSDALSKGGVVPWTYVGWSALAAAPAAVLLGMLGACLVNRRDVT